MSVGSNSIEQKGNAITRKRSSSKMVGAFYWKRRNCEAHQVIKDGNVLWNLPSPD
jgi:hypothetical protein